MAEAADGAAPPSDHVRIKRKKTTIFLYMESDATVHDLRAKVNHITKVPTSDIKFFIDKDGEIVVDENKTLAEQKIQSDDVVYMVYRKEGTEEWEKIEVDGEGKGDGAPKAEGA